MALTNRNGWHYLNRSIQASLLEKIDNILEDEIVVGYTVEGKPLTKELYNFRLEKAEDQLRNGEYITQEGLEKESENW